MPFFKYACFFSFSLLAASSFLPHIAYAGFKFVAPAEKEMSAEDQKNFAPTPITPQDFSIATPPEPVISETLDDISVMPSSDMNMVPIEPMATPMQAQPVSPEASSMPAKNMVPRNSRQTGLIIDPYPLGPHVASDHQNNIAASSVHKAMNEETGVAHPLQLGRNMSTMTKPVRIASTRQNMRQAPTPRTSLVPMPGGITAPEMPKVEYMDAVGFGRDLPLALALSQVVPPNYAFSFAEDDSAGATVSWEGGKPWDQVLNDMLEPQGLRAIIEEENKKVIISSSL